MPSKIIEVGYGSVKKVNIGGNGPLVLIGGPCAIENRDHALMMADRINKICNELNVHWIYKSCFDKDCRSSPDSFHGVGIDQGLEILSEVRSEFGIPVTSDFSDPAWAQAIRIIIASERLNCNGYERMRRLLAAVFRYAILTARRACFRCKTEAKFGTGLDCKDINSFGE